MGSSSVRKSMKSAPLRRKVERSASARAAASASKASRTAREERSAQTASPVSGSSSSTSPAAGRRDSAGSETGQQIRSWRRASAARRPSQPSSWKSETRNVGAAADGAVRRGEHLAHDAHDGGAALARGDGLHDAVGEEDEPDLVLVADRGEGEQARQLGGEVGLRARAGAEGLGAGDVDEEEDGEAALLGEALGLRGAGAGGDVPVDGADVVAGVVFADLLELEALAVERRAPVARQPLVHEAVGEDADGADLPHELHGVDHAADYTAPPPRIQERAEDEGAGPRARPGAFREGGGGATSPRRRRRRTCTCGCRGRRR